MKKIEKVALIASLAASLCASAKTVFLETEAFEDWGGWDTDHTHLLPIVFSAALCSSAWILQGHMTVHLLTDCNPAREVRCEFDAVDRCWCCG